MKIGNWPLLMMAIEHIIQYPETYNQTDWRCGTQRCLAGWIAQLSGGVWEGETGDSIWAYGVPHLPEFLGGSEDIAIQALRLDPSVYLDDFSRSLFEGDLDWESVLWSVLEYANEDGVTLTPMITTELTERGLIEGALS